MSEYIKCENCKYEDNCPAGWSYCNAACLVIQKEEELKPCPFCGREVKLVQCAPVFRYDIWAIVHKEKEPICFLWHSNGYDGKKKDVIKLWNQRTD